jgi:prevent-host-death family protein
VTSNTSTAVSFPSFPATKLKTNAGELLERARTAPVVITNHGRKTAYLVSAALFDRLLELEDAELIVMANEAIKGGVMTATDSLALLKSVLQNEPAAKQRRTKGSAGPRRSRAKKDRSKTA